MTVSFPPQLAEGANAPYLQLLNLFAYGTYPDYIGELVKILQRLKNYVPLFRCIASVRAAEVWDIKRGGADFLTRLCSHEGFPFSACISQW